MYRRGGVAGVCGDPPRRDIASAMPESPPRLRRQYANTSYPLVVLRFEDGHEIRLARGVGKTFDVYAGEVVKVLAIWDETSDERELLESRRGESFAPVSGPR